MQEVLPILGELHLALDMQMELETFVEKGNYFLVTFPHLSSILLYSRLYHQQFQS
jgi:hypothetical protein